MKTLLFLSVLLLSGCGTMRPQARIIDATNKEPWFARSVEKETVKDKHKDAYNDQGEIEKHNDKATSKRVKYDFSF